MSAPPSGTVSLLFSDIEGSTNLLARLGPAYVDVLGLHRSTLRTVWSTHRGREMGTEGDSFFVAFSTAIDAVTAAASAQTALGAVDWPDAARVRVRMGIHTGSPVAHDDGYIGMDVHRAARVAAAAHGGQIVITDVTRQLVADQLPPGCRTLDLGWHRLPDLPTPERLFQVSGAGFDQAFPPLRTLGAATRLPADLTPMVGREASMRRLIVLLGDPEVRLVSLTGAGGTGKTKLARALAGAVAERFADGVFFVPLALATEDGAMVGAVAEAVGATGGARETSELVELLRYRKVLLVLDNLEQLKGAASVVHDLLSGCPDLVVVTTTRAPLHLRGEHEYPVQALSLPAGQDLTAAGRSDAVSMFVRHAQMVRPDFDLDEENVGAVVAVCTRLDGLPLAIELAAARMRLLGPTALMDRLGTTLDLAAGTHDLPARQRSLRATIDWSYRLLRPEARRTLRHLGVFAGGSPFEAVDAVVATGVDSWDAVAELVDVALATVVDDDQGPPRVTVSESVHDFARERLAEENELAAARDLHSAYYVELAEELAPLLPTSRDLWARTRLETEYGNFREALTWTLQPGAETRPSDERIEAGLRLAAALRELWILPYPESDPNRWLERAAELGSGSDSVALAAVLASLGRGRDERIAVQALEMSRRLGDRQGMAEALHMLEWFHEGEPEVGQALLDESLALARACGDDVRLSWVLGRSADLQVRLGNQEEALDLLSEAVEVAQRRADERTAVEALLDSTQPLVDLGRVAEALAIVNDAVEVVSRVRDPRHDGNLFAAYALVAAALQDDVRSAQLIGAMEAVLAPYGPGWDPTPSEAWLLSSGISKARDRLGEAAWSEAMLSGAEITREDALALGAGLKPSPRGG